MKIDLHTHTIISGHAYSTILENLQAAREAGLTAFAVTDHGPAMPGVLGEAYHVVNMRNSVPEVLEGIRIIRGFEANIIDFDGNTDLPNDFAPSVEFIIGSLHEICIVPRSREENTACLINAMASGYVDAIGHPDGFAFPLDYPLLAEAAVEYKVALEVNNSSLKGRVRGDTWKNMREMVLAARNGDEVGVHAGTVVADFDPRFAVAVGDPDGDWFGRRAGIDRIGEEMADRLLEPRLFTDHLDPAVAEQAHVVPAALGGDAAGEERSEFDVLKRLPALRRSGGGEAGEKVVHLADRGFQRRHHVGAPFGIVGVPLGVAGDQGQLADEVLHVVEDEGEAAVEILEPLGVH